MAILVFSPRLVLDNVCIEEEKQEKNHDKLLEPKKTLIWLAGEDLVSSPFHYLKLINLKSYWFLYYSSEPLVVTGTPRYSTVSYILQSFVKQLFLHKSVMQQVTIEHGRNLVLVFRSYCHNKLNKRQRNLYVFFRFHVKGNWGNGLCYTTR